MGRRCTMSGDIQCGLKAYAFKQAAMLDALIIKYVSLWFPLVENQEILEKWRKKYGDDMKDVAEDVEEDAIEVDEKED